MIILDNQSLPLIKVCCIWVLDCVLSWRSLTCPCDVYMMTYPSSTEWHNKQIWWFLKMEERFKCLSNSQMWIKQLFGKGIEIYIPFQIKNIWLSCCHQHLELCSFSLLSGLLKHVPWGLIFSVLKRKLLWKLTEAWGSFAVSSDRNHSLSSSHRQ